jgi:hypothetical protein
MISINLLIVRVSNKISGFCMFIFFENQSLEVEEKDL